MQRYNLSAAIDIGPNDRCVDDLMATLRDYSPAIAPHQRGWTEVIITLPADSLAQATSTGLAILYRVKVPIVSIEVMTTAEFDARVGFDDTGQILSVTEAAATLHVSRQRVLQMIAEGKLPRRKVGSTFVIPAAAVTMKLSQ